MPRKTKPTPGGKRPGSGRPTLYNEPMIRRTIAMPAEFWVLAEETGNGNASQGIRRIMGALISAMSED